MTTYFYATKSGIILDAEAKGSKSYSHGIVAELPDGSAALLRQSGTIEAAEAGLKSKLIRETAAQLKATDFYIVPAELTATRADAEAETAAEADDDLIGEAEAPTAEAPAKPAKKAAKKAPKAEAAAKPARVAAGTKADAWTTDEEGQEWQTTTFKNGSWIKTRRRHVTQASGKVVVKIKRWAGESAEDTKGHNISSAQAQAAVAAGKYVKA